jgi:hypothetical protein
MMMKHSVSRREVNDRRTRSKPVSRLSWCLAALLTAAPGLPAAAQSNSCWSNPSNTPASGGFVCVKLTEALLLGLRDARAEDVEQAMGVPGRLSIAGRLHFISNYDNEAGFGSGEAAFSFGPDGRVVDIDATVSGGPTSPIILFVWTADGASCSDFQGSSSPRCDQ